MLVNIEAPIVTSSILRICRSLSEMLIEVELRACVRRGEYVCLYVSICICTFLEVYVHQYTYPESSCKILSLIRWMTGKWSCRPFHVWSAWFWRRKQVRQEEYPEEFFSLTLTAFFDNSYQPLWFGIFLARNKENKEKDYSLRSRGISKGNKWLHHGG